MIVTLLNLTKGIINRALRANINVDSTLDDCLRLSEPFIQLAHYVALVYHSVNGFHAVGCL